MVESGSRPGVLAPDTVLLAALLDGEFKVLREAEVYAQGDLSPRGSAGLLVPTFPLPELQARPSAMGRTGSQDSHAGQFTVLSRLQEAEGSWEISWDSHGTRIFPQLNSAPQALPKPPSRGPRVP